MPIWLAILILALILAFFLARRSMRHFQLEPEVDATLFLIRDSHLVNTELLGRLYSLAQAQNLKFSFERLFKGQESALVLFGPRSLVEILPELGLLELEDYLLSKTQFETGQGVSRIGADSVFGWLIPFDQPLRIDEWLLSNLDLTGEQQFFWQVVCQPVSTKDQVDEPRFQITLRSLISEPQPNERVRLAKRLFTHLNSHLGLTNKSELKTHPNFFESFRLRQIEKKNGKYNTLSSSEIVSLLTVTS